MFNLRLAASVYAIGLLAAGGGPADAQWNQFRGPNGSGVGSATGYPVSFSPTTNVLWKTAVPYGQSSPVVAAGHVYMTASDADRLLTICLDAASGRELWRREIHRQQAHQIFRANDPASPTPAADANGVVVFFADFGLAAYTAEGKDRWTLPLGPFKNFYGMAASPIIAGDLLVMVCDQLSGSFVMALDRKTGRQRWKTDRAAATIAWATPMVFRSSPTATAQLIVLGSTRLDSYTLDSGAPRWWIPLASGGAVGTAVASGDMLLVSTAGSTEPMLPSFATALSAYDKNKDGRLSKQEYTDKDLAEHFGWIDTDANGIVDAAEWNYARSQGTGDYGVIALRPDQAQGRLAPASVMWRVKKNLPYIPAPLAYDGVLYMVKDGGIITSLDPATGTTLKQGRSPEALGEYYASPVAADNKVYLANVEGKLTVLKAAAQWEVLRVNDLGEEVHATPALAGGHIYVRTRSSVYCFGAK